jgi:hypothetical protein
MRIEPMKRHLAPALFSLSLCAVMGGVRSAGAQTTDGAVAQGADSASVAMIAPVTPLALGAAAPVRTTTMTLSSELAPVRGPVILSPTGVRAGDARIGVETAPAAAPVMVDWKMPTSRALIIGGAATAIIGLAAVGGDTGAIIALSGTAVAVYGLYLHYNR